MINTSTTAPMVGAAAVAVAALAEATGLVTGLVTVMVLVTGLGLAGMRSGRGGRCASWRASWT